MNEFDLPVPTYVPWLGKTVEHPEGYGIYFQQRWDEAIQANPQFLYINDWNEWTAGKYQPAEGQTTPFMRRNSTYFFVDQYNAEFNRTIQPMKGGYTDNYYMQMAQNIRRYKGVRPIPELRGLHSMKIDGDFADWAAVDRRVPRHGRRHHPPRLPRLRRPALYERLGPQRHRHLQSRRGQRERLFLRRDERTAHPAHRQRTGCSS